MTSYSELQQALAYPIRQLVMAMARGDSNASRRERHDRDRYYFPISLRWNPLPAPETLRLGRKGLIPRAQDDADFRLDTIEHHQSFLRAALAQDSIYVSRNFRYGKKFRRTAAQIAGPIVAQKGLARYSRSPQALQVYEKDIWNIYDKIQKHRDEENGAHPLIVVCIEKFIAPHVIREGLCNQFYKAPVSRFLKEHQPGVAVTLLPEEPGLRLSRRTSDYRAKLET